MINCQESVNAAASARSTPQSPKDPFEAVPDKKNANDPFELLDRVLGAFLCLSQR